MIMTDEPIRVNDYVVLISRSNKNKYILKVEDKTQKISGIGIYNSAKLVGLPYGCNISLGSKEFYVLAAKNLDFLETIKRKAQIILPKDSAMLGLLANIGPGSLIVEGGLGSGALTSYLLHLVGKSGKVVTYELRKDFAKFGTENVKRVSEAKNWKLKLKDITKGIDERSVDSVILDIAQPWLVLDHAYTALKSGGYFACYLPTVNQVERLVGNMRELPFIEIATFENLQRELVVKPGATRPAFDMLGHTGYITVGRKIIKT